MADENPNLRALACIQRHGAHFMDGRDPRSNGFLCKHCGLYNVSCSHFIAGVSLWVYKLPVGNVVRAYKNGETVYEKGEGATNEEVRYALQLVGYRATDNDSDG